MTLDELDHWADSDQECWYETVDIRRVLLEFSIEILNELSRELTVKELESLEKISHKISELEKLKQ